MIHGRNKFFFFLNSTFWEHKVGEMLLKCLLRALALARHGDLIHLRAQRRLRSASPEALPLLRKAPPDASGPAGTKSMAAVAETVLSMCHMRTANSRSAQLRKAPAGTWEPADQPSEANQDSAMCCCGWNGQIYIGSKWPVLSSQKTYNSGSTCSQVGSAEFGEILHLRTRTTSWHDRTRVRRRKQPEERPWYLSPFGRPEQIRDSWSCVLHRFAKLLHHSTCAILPTDERRSSKVTGTLGAQELSRIHSTGWETKNFTTYMQWELQHEHNKSMPDGLRKEPAPWFSSSGGVTKLETQTSNHAQSGSFKESIRPRLDAPVCLCQNHCGSPSPSPAHARVAKLSAQ